jgi:hypothetical protein
VKESQAPGTFTAIQSGGTRIRVPIGAESACLFAGRLLFFGWGALSCGPQSPLQR